MGRQRLDPFFPLDTIRGMYDTEVEHCLNLVDHIDTLEAKLAYTEKRMNAWRQLATMWREVGRYGLDLHEQEYGVMANLTPGEYYRRALYMQEDK